MKSKDLLDAFGSVDAKYVKSVDVFYRTAPTWRTIMKKSAKFAVTAAAVVVALGLVFGAWFIQTKYGVSPGKSLSVLDPETEGTLKIVTEEETGFGGYYRHTVLFGTTQVMKWFKTMYPNVKLQVQVLSQDHDAREAELEKLRLEIMSGDGPDVYLLPTGSLIGMLVFDDSGNLESVRGNWGYLDPLFSDVEQAMRNGMFLDLSPYYDADTVSQGLKADVMDGGVLNGERLVLPLGYNMPVIYADREGLAAYGLTPEDLPTDLPGLQKLALEMDEPALAAGVGALPRENILDTFDRLWDYDTETVLLGEEELTSFALRQREIRETNYEYRRQIQEEYAPLIGWESDIYNWATRHFYNVENPAKSETYGGAFMELAEGDFPNFTYGEQFPFQVGSLARAGETAAIAKVLDRDLEILPLTTPDGTQSATVTFWGAVDAKSANPRLAYEFLRIFLSPEVQLQQGFEVEGAPEGENILEMNADEAMNAAWPVRVDGSVEALVKSALSGVKVYASRERLSALNQLDLSDDLLPVLQAPVDRVRFPTELDGGAGKLLGSDPEKDVEQQVRDYLRDVEYHLGEG